MNPPPAARRSPVLAAALWMSGTLASFVLMAIGGRELSATLGTAEILFFRSFFGLVLLGAMILPTLRFEAPAPLRTARLGLHVLRNVAHFGGQYGWFLGIAAIPLTEVFALEFTVPVWTAMLATVLLGERLTPTRVAAVVLGFVGVLVMLRPGLAAVHPAALAVLAGAASYGLSHTLTRSLTRTEAPLAVLFYMSLVQLPLGFAFAAGQWIMPGADQWPWLFAIAVCGLSGHYCLTRALTLADVTVVMPIDFLRLPLIALLANLLYGEPLDVFVAVGAAIMLLANLLNLRPSKDPVVD